MFSPKQATKSFNAQQYFQKHSSSTIKWGVVLLHGHVVFYSDPFQQVVTAVLFLLLELEDQITHTENKYA